LTSGAQVTLISESRLKILIVFRDWPAADGPFWSRNRHTFWSIFVGQ